MILNNKNIQSLVSQSKGTLKVSIYIPTNPHSNGKTIEQDRTRFKNALQEVKNHHAYNNRELGSVLEKIYSDLFDSMTFWNYQDYGLAVLFDASGYEYFHLPFELTEAEYVSDHYIVSPLFIMASANTNFFLLDVNFNQPRLFEVSRGNIEEITVENMPKSFDKSYARDWYKNHTLGNENNAENADERSYLTEVAVAIDEYLSENDAPLLLAGTTNRTGNIRQLLKYKNILNKTLVGNKEEDTTQELYEKSSEVLRGHLKEKNDARVSELKASKPEHVVMGRKEIEEAAGLGKVKTLFLPVYNVTSDSISPSAADKIVLVVPDDIEDIETMVTKVLMQSGELLPVEIDKYEVLNDAKALLRF